MDLHGKNLVAGEWMDGRGDTTFQATNPTNGQKLEPAFLEASSAQADTAISEAHDAFQVLRTTAPEQRAGFLETLATNVESKADTILQRAEQETALGKARLHLELSRTIAQPRLFAELIREGSWVDAKIDRADPNRKPLPRPSMRSMVQPIGPIAVFGASNFPLAI